MIEKIEQLVESNKKDMPRLKETIYLDENSARIIEEQQTAAKLAGQAVRIKAYQKKNGSLQHSLKRSQKNVNELTECIKMYSSVHTDNVALTEKLAAAEEFKERAVQDAAKWKIMKRRFVKRISALKRRHHKKNQATLAKNDEERTKFNTELEKKDEEWARLKAKVEQLNVEVRELQCENALLDGPVIKMHTDGRYTKEAKEMIMILRMEYNVGITKMGGIVRTVILKLTKRTLDRFPSKGYLIRIIKEGQNVEKQQEAEEILSTSMDSYDSTNETTDNTLLFEEKTKDSQHFQGFQLATTTHKKSSKRWPKVIVKQQRNHIDEYLENPPKLVGRIINHCCKDPVTKEVEWFRAKVCQQLTDGSSRNILYTVKYDGYDSEYEMPLLIDLRNGDVRLEED